MQHLHRPPPPSTSVMLSSSRTPRPHCQSCWHSYNQDLQRPEEILQSDVENNSMDSCTNLHPTNPLWGFLFPADISVSHSQSHQLLSPPPSSKHLSPLTHHQSGDKAHKCMSAAINCRSTQIINNTLCVLYKHAAVLLHPVFAFYRSSGGSSHGPACIWEVGVAHSI